ncbi:alpha/beta-hydrolase [Sodiomyces alkalinus F11]|uniref:Alpha/beta-hydrolase n=1 Tax=Sodiomyces alkalinus (strain CBS 110278 / VKM F-3762 / F11) TaxID=1314773 RepID=A0A3N2Q1D5_SODAK|nr:alpha/beta-hydrolase [Sodiomyces alkalinus F11]ROT40560.1 alpha/beta-hydrolase [Sodiomyces alkalinus F11]
MAHYISTLAENSLLGPPVIERRPQAKKWRRQCEPHYPQRGLNPLEKRAHRAAVIEALTINVDEGLDGFVSGFLHMPPDFIKPAPTTHHRTAAILLSGAGGGVTGPSSIYLSLACKLATLSTGIPTLRLDYRAPARNRYCVQDVRAAMAYLEDMYGLNRFILVGWSFGGAPVFTVAGGDKRVVGCATVASQTAETEGIRKLAPRPLLLLHGTADRTLSSTCSERLFSMYGDRRNGRLQLFEGDNHVLSGNAQAAEAMLCDFIASCAGLRIGEEEHAMVVEEELIQDGERKSLMKRGGDLRAPETED